MIYFWEKIILALGEIYSPDIAQAATLQGVEGILVVTQEQPPLTSQFEVSKNPDADLCLVDDIPVPDITVLGSKEIFWNKFITI